MAGEVLRRLASRTKALLIMRTHSGTVLPSEDRRLRFALRQEVADGIVTRLRVQIATDVTMDVIASMADVDAHRRALAGGDSTLNSVLVEIEMNHVHLLAGDDVTLRHLLGGLELTSEQQFGRGISSYPDEQVADTSVNLRTVVDAVAVVGIAVLEHIGGGVEPPVFWLLLPLGLLTLATCLYSRRPGVRTTRALRASMKQGDRQRDGIRRATETTKSDMDCIERECDGLE